MPATVLGFPCWNLFSPLQYPGEGVLIASVLQNEDVELLINDKAGDLNPCVPNISTCDASSH